jgi:Na+/proline symporter
MSLPSISIIDILIFVVFFVLNIIVGFRYRGKRQSFREYAIGDKKFSTATLTATLVATFASGSVLFVGLENTYQKGLYYALATLIGATARILIAGRIVGPRMGKFLDNVSLPDALGKLYGKYVQLIAGISCVILSVGYIAVQFKIMAKILAIVFNYESPIVVIIAAAIVTLYSLSGGVKAVTFTDVLQFFTFGTLLPIIALTIWNNLQDHSQVVHMLKTNPLFSLKEVIGWSPEFLHTLALMVYFAIPELAPEIFQRIAMAKDTTQVKHSMTWSALIFLGLKLCIMWIAILLLTDQTGLASNEVVPYMVNTHLYTGLKGFLGIGVIALSMSTADSTINSTAVIIANDVLPPLKLQKEGSLKAAKNATLFLGIFAVFLALRIQGLLELILFSACFYAPIVVVPMLLAVFGFQTSRRVVLLGMGAGAAAVSFLLFVLHWDEVICMPPSLLANLIVMLGAHYLLQEKGGWQRLAPNDPLALERAARRQAWQWRLNAIKSFRLYPYLQHNLPSQEGFYFFFGLYTIAATYAAFYTVGDVESQAYQAINTGIYYTVLPVITAFLTLAIWPDSLKKSRFIAFFWPLGIGGILFFAGTLLAIMSHFHHIQVMIMMINLLLSVLLLQWPLALFLAFTGTCTAVLFFTHYTGTALPLSTLGSMQMIYLILLFASLLIALKGRQVYRGLVISHAQLREDNHFTNRAFLAALRHQARLQQEASLYPLAALERSEPLHAFQQTPTKAQLMASNAALHQYVYALDTLNKHLRQMLHLAQEPMHLVVESIDLDAIWQDVRQTLYQHNRSIKVILQHHAKTKLVQGDSSQIRRLLYTAVAYAAAYPKTQRPILLHIEDTQLAYPIVSIPGYVKHIEALLIMITTESTLPILKKWYLGSVDHLSLQCPQDIGELSLTYNQQIIAAHYGATEMISTATGVTQVYVLPKDVRSVRPPTMDQWQVTTSSDRTAEIVHPAEHAFVQQVLAKTPMEHRLLQEALQVIKQYHATSQLGTSEPAYLHPIAVAHTLLAYTQNVDTLLAALLHDTIDTTRLSWHYIALRFNPVVQRIVEGVTSVDTRLSSFKKIQLSNQEAILKLLEVKDERVLYVKLADRLHHTRTMETNLPPTQQKSMAEETLQFYVPFATHLGLTPIAEELKEKCLKVINVHKL